MRISVAPYHSSLVKRVFNFIASFLGLIAVSPIIIFIYVLLKAINHGPVFYIQQRTGKNGQPFNLIKFRTMHVAAHARQKFLKKHNEADGPVFKIYSDPRFTKFGRVLAHTGLDELPQLINVLKGDMSLVGPRPLPVAEARKIPIKYKVRELIRPGITSTWVINGSHKLKFTKWMDLDRKYITQANLTSDIFIIIKTLEMIIKGVYRRLTQ